MCANIIELKDRYFENIEEREEKLGKVELVRKEYLFIVTDYLPYTVSDLKVTQDFSCLASIKQVMHGIFKGL